MTLMLYSPAALLILLVTVALSIYGLNRPQFVMWAMLRPYRLFRERQYEKLITSGFVHADWSHLIFNAITFYFFAFPLERRIGSLRFVSLYFIGMVLSEIGTCLKHRNDPNYASLGASGAILAVLFASIVYFPNNSLFIFPLPIPIPAPLFAVGYLVYSYYQSRQNVGNVNHDAHIGGALTGLAFVALTDPRAYRRLLEMIF
ncbi:MAG TPA: rhomboid family intramembrane serine protease [Steroidobacteraceae bacterium]|jgi:membrane associated rhomboid family serine protease|nr:rhomboid family intramembrane serine protease [Steroidobacteraceae bacterium]